MSRDRAVESVSRLCFNKNHLISPGCIPLINALQSNRCIKHFIPAIVISHGLIYSTLLWSHSPCLTDPVYYKIIGLGNNNGHMFTARWLAGGTRVTCLQRDDWPGEQQRSVWMGEGCVQQDCIHGKQHVSHITQKYNWICACKWCERGCIVSWLSYCLILLTFYALYDTLSHSARYKIDSSSSSSSRKHMRRGKPVAMISVVKD